MSVTSCLIRSDFNIIIAYLTIIIMRKYFHIDEKNYLKVIIHLNAVAILYEIIWIAVSMSSWVTTEKINFFWDGQRGMRVFGIILAFLELAIKGGIVALSVLQFNKMFRGELKLLVSFSYKEIKI